MDTIDEMLSMLLGGGVEALDISPALQQVAVDRYREVGEYLSEHAGYDSEIYPQGSFRLGTVVRPMGGYDYDIDLVCRLLISKHNVSQAELKAEVGRLLRDYIAWKNGRGDDDGPDDLEVRRRCWTLLYIALGFHLDVLPALPDTDNPPTGILLTDKQLHHWQFSDPIGYGRWFRTRSEELQRRLIEAAQARKAEVADVPEWAVRSTLQRLVQVLKWHCMYYFRDDPDVRPPSILITTLASWAYSGQTDLFTAAKAAAANMNSKITKVDGKWCVLNPAVDGENFADKWNDYPERRRAYFDWHSDLCHTLDDLSSMTGAGLPTVTTRLAKSFGLEPSQRAAVKVGEQLADKRSKGTLRMRTGGLLSTGSVGVTLPEHQFYGGE